MTKLTTIAVALVALSLGATSALAKEELGDGGKHKKVVSAPELDLAQGMGALVLLGGTIAILRGRRGKK